MPETHSYESLEGHHWFWYASVGVFGFEALLKNLNLTLYDKGVLTINDWISKSRTVAIADVIKSQAIKDLTNVQKLANLLMDKLSGEALKTHVLNELGAPKLQEIEDSASSNGADPILALALELADANSNKVVAILKNVNKKN